MGQNIHIPFKAHVYGLRYITVQLRNKICWDTTCGVSIYKTGSMKRNLASAANFENLQMVMVFSYIINYPKLAKLFVPVSKLIVPRAGTYSCVW